jgi:cysteine-rich repeat protein
VLTPGSQNGGFVDGAKGNLSDTTAGKKGDQGSGDAVDNRTFVVEGGAIVSYQGTHQTGTSPNGKLVIQLMPFDDTANNGGVYILAVCEVGATSPSQCKFDAFKVKDKDKDDCGDDGCDDDDDCGDDGDCGDDDDDCGDDGDCDEECGSDDCDDECDGGCEPSAPYCGDGTTDAGEGCDDGNTSDGDGCSANCTVEVPEPCCGDGMVDAGEGCDDGNVTSGDGCSADCQVEPSIDCSPCE